MPIYEYRATSDGGNCSYCAAGFEQIQRMSDPRLTKCPRCSAPVRRVFSAPSIGASKSGFDARAKNAGFQKLQRVGKGEYERTY
jgi:putative FmdB family regulatory protein